MTDKNARIEADFQERIRVRLSQIHASLAHQGYAPDEYRIDQSTDFVDGRLVWRGETVFLPKPKATD